MSVLWLPLALLAYLMQAVIGTIDRAIVHKEVTKPIIISFWVAIFSVPTAAILLVGLLPFEWAEQFAFQTPDSSILIRAIASGFLVQLSLFLMYKALHDWEATRVLSIMGAITPIATAFISYFFLEERLGPLAGLAVAVLVAGTVALTMGSKKPKAAMHSHRLAYSVAAAVTLAIQSVLIKTVFDEFQFISAYALTAIGALTYLGVIAAFSGSVRQQIYNMAHPKPKAKPTKKQPKSQVLMIFINSMLGGLSVIILSLAIDLGTPTQVNSLRGVQYAGLFVIALVLAKRRPHLLDEELTRRSIIQKISGIMLVIIGVALIAISA